MESSLQHLHSWTLSTVSGSSSWSAWELRSSRERPRGAGATGTVRFWSRSSGWGVIDSPETPGRLLGRGFSALPSGRAWLETGQTVLVDWHAPRRWETRLGHPSRVERNDPELWLR